MMSRSPLNFIFFSAVSITLVSLSLQKPAVAGGEIYTRQAISNSSYQCNGGRLVEQYHESGNAHESSAGLTLACLQSSETAKWVLIAIAHCNTRQVSPNTYSCNNFPWKAQINWTKDYKYTDRTHIYTTGKYLLGQNCSVVYENSSYENREKPFKPDYTDSWKCESIKLFPKLDISIVGDRKFIPYNESLQNGTWVLPGGVKNPAYANTNSYINGDKYE
jgi:hypothetical protein